MTPLLPPSGSANAAAYVIAGWKKNVPAGAELENRIPIPSSQLSRRYIYIFIYIYRFRVPLPRSSPCRKRLFSCQGTGEKNLSSGRHRENRKLEHFWKEFFSSCGRHRDGSKLNTQRKIFSLCAQWARIFDSTCGPVGQKFPPTGLEVAFTYSEFQRGQSQPSREKTLTPLVSKLWEPPESG